MNERIRELMRGAIADALMQTDRDGDMDKMYIPLLFAENFAELLIRECVSTLEQHHPYAKDPEAYLYAISLIEEHFGVEE